MYINNKVVIGKGKNIPTQNIEDTGLHLYPKKENTAI